MCGLGGYVGVQDRLARLSLVYGLGFGIDRRGGHAAGFVSTGDVLGKAIKVSRKVGTWKDASTKFFRKAGSGTTCVMHARYATCGKKDAVAHAHPFTIRRDGKDVIYGAHNGVISGTDRTAKEYGRDHTVDSREVYELIADGNLSDLQELEGYGVLTWLTPGSDAVNVALLSKRADFIACTVEGGGVVWASTESILTDALKVASLARVDTLKLHDVGVVYQLSADGVKATELTGVNVKAPKPYVGSNTTYDYSGEWWNQPRGMSLYSGGNHGNRRAYEEWSEEYDRRKADREAKYEAFRAKHAALRAKHAVKADVSALNTSGKRRKDGTFPPFTQSDGTVWNHNGKHWEKAPKAPVSDLSSAQAQEPEKDTQPTQYCAHWTSLYAYCCACGPGRWENGKRIQYEKLMCDRSPNDINHATEPQIRIAESAGNWPMAKTAEPRFADGKLPEWDSMTDAEIDSITDEEWDLISDAYIGERMRR